MKNIFTKHINRKEYVHLLAFQFIGLSFIYNFINIDLLSGLKKGVYNGDILPVVYFSVIYTIVMIAMYVFVNLLRINETKISKWSLFALFVPYINFIYLVLLACYPPKVELHDNRKTRISLLVVGFFLFTCVPVLIIHGLSPKFGAAIFLTLAFFIIVFLVEKLIKLSIFAYKKAKNYYIKCDNFENHKVKLFNFVKSIVCKLKNKIKFNTKLKHDSSSSLAEKLQELSKLKEQGLITEEDYNNKKTKLLEDF